MGALPRPDVPPGPQRDLVEALHALHHRAGWPSLRLLAREAGCSHTTVSTVFSSRRLPTWGMLQLVVEAMDGDVAEFRPLWLAASSTGPVPVVPVELLAGRGVELTTVRRHLGQGAGGLLLVRGVAGIGKTRLVQAAVTSSAPATTVGWGSCIPLATDVPLLPLVDVLRSVHEVDAGQWLKEALAERPPYMARSLARLLPELAPSSSPAADPDDDWSGHRLFAAVEGVLSALGSLRPFGVVLEDLHWADVATLDLVEHLLARRVSVPLVATWRTEDAAVPAAATAWCARVRRLEAVHTLSLGALTREETAAQIAMVSAGRSAPPLVDTIYERSEGLPLFTEQLVAAPDPVLPELLGELLDQRLLPLDEPEWRVVRALATAGRPLSETLLGDVTGLPSAALASALHDLDARHLLRTGRSDRVGLRHALLAEAAARRLTAHETADEHRRLASSLAATPDPVAAEVAEHWQRAGDTGQELVWRIRAAQQAASRFAFVQAATQWRRALDLWPDAVEAVGSPAVRRVDAYVAAMDALGLADAAAGRTVAEEALRALDDHTGRDAADTYRNAAGFMEEPDEALRLAERAVAIYEQLPPCPGYVKALATQAYVLDCAGRDREAATLAARATEVSAGLGDPALHRTRLAVQASLEPRLDVALAQIELAVGIELPEPDLFSDVYVATIHTHALLITNAAPEEVAAAARPVLRAAAGEEHDTWPLSVLRCNVVTAYRRAGQVGRAAELLDPRTEDPVSFLTWAEHSERVLLDAVRGRHEAAARRLAELSAVPFDTGLSNLVETTEAFAEAELWGGRPQAAYDRAVDLVRTCAPTDASGWVAGLLVLVARAAADLAASGPPTTREQLLGSVLALRDGAVDDPFEPLPADPTRAALASAWTAETLRLAGRATVETWVAAARGWDRLSRPHEAAYCRWRAAEVALRTGQGSAARSLLQRARHDAREHVPLLTAIAATG